MEPESNGSSRKLADILREAGISASGSGGRRRRGDDEPDGYSLSREVDHPTGHSGGERRISSTERDIFGSDPGYFDSEAPYAKAPYAKAPYAKAPYAEAEPRFLGTEPQTFGDRQFDNFDDVDGSSERNGVLGTADSASQFEDDYGLSAYLLAEPDTRGARSPSPAAPPSPVEPARQPVRRGPVPRTDTGPVTAFGWARSSRRGSATSISSRAAADAEPAAAELEFGTPETSSDTAVAGKETESNRSAPDRHPANGHANRSASPLASGTADGEQESVVPLRGGAASWVILAVEMLAALGLGIAAWYAFSALWELLPYLAAFIGPVVVTGLVAVAGALRARTGRNPLGLPTLCILVFAGTVLVVLPAATVIIP